MAALLAALAFSAEGEEEEEEEATAFLAADAASEALEPVPGAAAADLAELVWKETCSSAERNEGCDEEEEVLDCILEAATDEAEAATAATTR